MNTYTQTREIDLKFLLLSIALISATKLSAAVYSAEPRLASLPSWFKNRAPAQEFNIDYCSHFSPDAIKQYNPSKLGPFQVNTKFIKLKSKVTGREIISKVFSANTPTCRNFENPPLVLFLAPGFIGSVPWPLDFGKTKLYDMQVYEGYMHHLASYGFTVAGLYEPKGSLFSKLDSVDHKRDAIEISSMLTDLINKKEEEKLHFDEDKIAIMGHSKGAKLAFLSATMDKRYKVILAVDPVNSGGPPCFISKTCTKYPVAPNPKNGDAGILDQIEASTLLLKAPIDKLWNPDPQFNAIHFYNGLESETYLAEINAGHASWMFNEKVKSVTRALFLAYLFDKFHHYSPFSEYLEGEKFETARKSGLLGRTSYKTSE